MQLLVNSPTEKQHSSSSESERRSLIKLTAAAAVVTPGFPLVQIKREEAGRRWLADVIKNTNVAVLEAMEAPNIRDFSKAG